MADKTFTNVRIKNKTDTLTNWSTKNPTLKAGELAIYENSYTYRTSRSGSELTDTSPAIKVSTSSKTFMNAQRVDLRAYREAVTAAIEQDESLIEEYSLEQIKSIAEGTDSHNSLYRGKNLTNVYTLAQLHAKVSAGDFEDLFLGDYWTTSKGIAYMIYGFNPMYNQGDTSIITQPHIGLIARSPSNLPTAKYAETTGATGGYINSFINNYLTYTESVFASDAGLEEVIEYLIRAQIYASSANDNNGTTANSWMNCKFWLPSDAEICGYPRAGTPTTETAWSYSKLPVFNYISPNRFGRSATWTRTLASGGNAIRINNNGIRGVAAKTSELGVRPCMIFG